MLPQIIYVALCLVGLGIVMAKHGQPQKNYNVWTALLSQAIIFSLLWWGGFFNVFFK